MYPEMELSPSDNIDHYYYHVDDTISTITVFINKVVSHDEIPVHARIA